MHRLLLYLGLTFFLVLITAAGIMYNQFQMISKQELQRHTNEWQAQTGRRIEQAFAELDRSVRLTAREPAIQRFVTGEAEPENRQIKEDVDSLLRSFAAGMPYINEMCVMRKENASTLCLKLRTEESGLGSIALPPFSRNDRLLLLQDLINHKNNNKGKHMIHVTPAMDRTTNVVKGAILLSIDPERLFRTMAENGSGLSLTVYDEQGSVIFQSERAAEWDVSREEEYVPGFSWSGDQLVVRRNLDISQVTWYARTHIVSPHSFQENRLLWMVILVLGFGCLVAITVSRLLYKPMFREPMERLRSLMKRAELGDLKAYWVGRGSREWNELGESYNQMLNRLEESLKQVKKEEGLKKEAEMEALKYQLNPHFLYNTLNTIKWVAKMHRTPQIAEAVTALVKLLQASLGKKGDFITVQEELELIRAYMEIQRFRYGDKIKLVCDIEPVSDDCLLPCMLLQPLVENAIVHGIEPAKKDGLITIRINVDMNRELLICEVKDNGVGMPAPETADEMLTSGNGSARERMTGIGLQHIREKIKLYFGNGYHMHITGKPGEGTSVRLMLPVHRIGG